MTTTTLATKFEVGKTYHSENGVKTYTVLRRTEKTVWLETEDNTIIQKRVKVTNFGNEKITDNFLETTSDCETTSTNLQDNVETLKGWEYINSQAEYENRNNSNYIVFSKLSTANYNGEFYGYFEKVYNWLDTLTSEQLDNIVGSFKDIDPNKHYINFYYRAMELYQATPIGNPNKTPFKTSNEPCTLEPTPALITPSTTVTESQESQDELVKTYVQYL